jgi:protein-tyrosine phosphatase
MKALRRVLGLGSGREPELRVLMICSGNICRSPTAEGVLRAKLQRAGLADRVAVDSAGVQGLHAKEAPDPRAQAHARRRGYDLSKLRARKIVAEDFNRFDLVLAMDIGHLGWLRDNAPAGARARLELLMQHAGVRSSDGAEASTGIPSGLEVPDPYYGSDRDFERVLDLVERACDGLVLDLQRQLAGSKGPGVGNA